MTDQLNEDQLFDYYWKFRTAEENHKSKMEAAKKGKEQILQLLAQLFPQTSVKNHAHHSGTFMYNTRSYARVQDADAFMEWVFNEDQFQALKKDCAKKAIEEYIESTGKVPPGIDYGTVIKPTIRKPTTTGELDVE